MLRRLFKPNLAKDLSQLRIIKNLIVISAAFLFLYTGDEGLLALQTTINKEKGVGTITLAVVFFTYGLTSLLFSSFLVKKLGSKNGQFMGVVMILPFIASNFYPARFTMFPSGVFRGMGKSLLWAAQSTYFNDSSALFCKNRKKRKQSSYPSNIMPKKEKSEAHEEIVTFKSREQKLERLSAGDLLIETETNSVSNRKSTTHYSDTSSIVLTAYINKHDILFQDKILPKENNPETTTETKSHDLEIFNDFPNDQNNSLVGSKEGTISEDIKDKHESEEYQSYVNSTKALFFGMHGLAYHSATIWSSLISYYVLETSEEENSNKTYNLYCGTKFCPLTKDDDNNSIGDIPADTRRLLVGVCLASAILAPFLILFLLDPLIKKEKNVKFSWDHVSATIKYIKKKDQLLLIPFTIGASLCRGFYLADFTKSYIACAWSISHIGMITIINGVMSALSSLFSGVVIKYVGRKSVLVLCQLLTIANFIFLSFWIPTAEQPYMFYIQGGIFGIMSGVFNSQTRALYGIFFEGDEATAFSSCNLYSSIGWTLPFIYNDLLCVSVKIYLVLAFCGTGLFGYLLAERNYSVRNHQIDSSK